MYPFRQPNVPLGERVPQVGNLYSRGALLNHRNLLQCHKLSNAIPSLIVVFLPYFSGSLLLRPTWCAALCWKHMNINTQV